MPDIFEFKCKHWELTVWTRDNDTPKKLLSAVLKERSSELPTEKICFSFSLSENDSFKFLNADHPVEPKTSEIEIPEPLCYENRDYEFEFRFRKGSLPNRKNPVSHRLKEVESRFRSKDNSVRGVLNFENNIGCFKLGISYSCEGKPLKDTISFRVYPTKMDMKEDLDKICEEIDSVYPLWRFSLAQKTDSYLSRSNKHHESFELLWTAQFRSLAQELAGAVKLICRSPHNRLIPKIKNVKAEKIRGKLKPKLEEKIKENLAEKQFNKHYLIEKKKLSFDTPENRFIKMVLQYSVKRLKLFNTRVKELETKPENVKLSETFFKEIRELISPFEKLSAEPLFMEIGSYDGRMRESLVLHQRSGYSKVYRIWQNLKLYLDYFGSDASVSVRSVEQLYEIWCLLEIRKQLIKLGFDEDKKTRHNLKTAGFEKKLKKAEKTFKLYRRDGMEAFLIHEPSYSGQKKDVFDKIYSWTTTQRPDILLEVAFPSGDKARWVFDAKYRIDSNKKKEWPQKGIDTVPDDAVNQMHRYRDSLIYISKASEDGSIDKSRPIIGAFALYPGWFDQENYENPYKDSIEAVGIGAFPLLPGHENNWIESFLKNQLGECKKNPYEEKSSDNLYLQEAMRIPTYGMKQHRHNDLTLAAHIYDSKNKSKPYLAQFKKGNAQWYHIPESTVQNYKISRYVMREIKYCAFTTNTENGRECRYLYPVESVVLKPRNKIDQYAGGPTSKGGNSLYWLLKLGQSFKPPAPLQAKERHRKFKFKLVSFNNFLNAVTWDDIHVDEKYFKTDE